MDVQHTQIVNIKIVDYVTMSIFCIIIGGEFAALGFLNMDGLQAVPDELVSEGIQTLFISGFSVFLIAAVLSLFIRVCEWADSLLMVWGTAAVSALAGKCTPIANSVTSLQLSRSSTFYENSENLYVSISYF